MVARIKEKKEIAKGTLMVTYDLLGQNVDFKPGQYFFVTLKNSPYTDTRGLRRHFSIVNSPTEEGIITMTTRMGESALKRSLRELPIGTEVEIGPILGNFFLPDDTSRPLVFIAGGIGITPFISMIRYIRDKKLSYKITLIYSNRDTESSPFLDELRQLEKEIKAYKLIATMTKDENWSGEKRRIDEQFLKDYITDLNANDYYVAGPPKMVEQIAQTLKNAGVESSNIKLENFSGY